MNVPHIYDLFEINLFNQSVALGHIKVQKHPELPLSVANYTDACVYAGAWNAATLNCRGLIYDNTGKIIARPFKKFFNHGEDVDLDISGLGKPNVYEKRDGCFPRGTPLNLWGGGTVSIDKVVRNRLTVTLVGMNEHGELVPTVVTDWHNNGRKDHWIDIEVDTPISRKSGAGGHPTRLRVTTNHHIYVNGEYRPASDIRPGDILTTQTWEPDEGVLHIVKSSLLGDGSVMASATKPDQAKYQEGHVAKHVDYVEALRKAMGECLTVRPDTTSGYGSSILWVGAKEYAKFGELRREWYQDGKRVLPADLSWIDDFAVAKWYMDDGSNTHNAKQRDRATFSTHAFTEDDCRRLATYLSEKYGVKCVLAPDKRGRGRGFSIRINAGKSNQIDSFWSAIAPYVHPVMRYKLPKEYRDAPYQEMGFGRELVVPKDAVVKSINPVEPTKKNFPHGRTGYDITTSTGNYMAKGLIVHNSMGTIYPLPDGTYAVATRGSFASEQAIWATEWLRKHMPDFAPEPGTTQLVEIIYPDNRIVVDYEGYEGLVSLAVIDNATGLTLWDASPGWTGDVVEQYYLSLEDALAAEDRPNREGYVLHFTDHDIRIKLKHKEYVRLHHIMTGATELAVWRALASGDGLDAMLDGAPDDLKDWVDMVATTMRMDVAKWVAGRVNEFELIKLVLGATDLKSREGRKAFAAQATDHQKFPGAMFALLDGKDITSMAYDTIRPHGTGERFSGAWN